MKKSLLILSVFMLTACSTYRYPEPANPTKEFYQAKNRCQREANEMASIGSRSNPFGRPAYGTEHDNEREYFLTCMKGEGF